ncbi:hypothetical protein C8D77_114113 [Mesorhizobium loti]|uniref:Uncharacterized protein n=1 Tax=Rhizobium loti TaxID=381 RepID=A0A8E2WAE9_RHILI|nr:hypothetical protein [Mesorhizobium loti]PWJ87822.1 hypothetical protein C8D77_114113 [Mesorhizobium loti]
MTGGEVAVQLTSGPSIYATVDPELEFRQGEIISGIVQYRYYPEDGSVEEIPHAYALIASQDCDLLQDHNSKAATGASQLNSVLLYEAHETPILRSQVAGSDIWKRIVQNNDERYHALEAAHARFDLSNVGLPDLVVDFRRFFSISTADLAKQIQAGTAARRCRLEMPYREQFQTRAAFYLQRVGVPEPHKIAKVASPNQTA